MAITHSSKLGMTRRWMIPTIVDGVCCYVSLYLALSVGYRGVEPMHSFIVTAAKMTPFFCVCLLIQRILDLYEFRVVRQLPVLVQSLMVSGLMELTIGSAYVFAIIPGWGLSRGVMLLVTLIGFNGSVLVSRRIWLMLCKKRMAEQKVVFLGHREHVQMLRRDLARLSLDTGFSPVEWRWPGVDLVVADGEWIDEHWEEAKDVFLAAVGCRVPVVTFEHFYESLLGKVSPGYASHPSWSLEFVLPSTRALYPRVKRMIDTTFAVLFVAALSPILGSVALLILLCDGRPIFYRQKRIGYRCQEFMIWKFRTMSRAADQMGPFMSAQDGESRITRLGTWLRRFRIDELPQLWNVVRGEMSLVGPRPEWDKEVEFLEKVIPYYHLRHLVPPGITGWAQVYFKATNNHVDSMEKLHYDLYYLKYFSPALDFSIILKTLKRMFVRDSRIKSLPTLAPRTLETPHFWIRDFSAAGRSPARRMSRSWEQSQSRAMMH